jgi:hypothetical protein
MASNIYGKQFGESVNFYFVLILVVAWRSPRIRHAFLTFDPHSSRVPPYAASL